MAGAAVTAGTPATLTCSLSDLAATVTAISWYEGETKLEDSDAGEYNSAGNFSHDVLKTMILRDECFIVLRCFSLICSSISSFHIKR